MSPTQDPNILKDDNSLDWDNYASDPSYISVHETATRYLHSSTRDDLIDANSTDETLEDEIFGTNAPSLPPRARRATSVIQCNSYTCKPTSMRRQSNPEI